MSKASLLLDPCDVPKFQSPLYPPSRQLDKQSPWRAGTLRRATLAKTRSAGMNSSSHFNSISTHFQHVQHAKMMQEIEAVSSVYKAIKQKDAKSMSNDRNILSTYLNYSTTFNHKVKWMRLSVDIELRPSKSKSKGAAARNLFREMSRNVRSQ